MITTQRFLNLKQLIKYNYDDSEHDTVDIRIWNDKSSFIYCGKSWESLYILFERFTIIKGRVPVVIFPEYYCNDTLNHLRNISLVKYYRINEKLEIDLEQIRTYLNTENECDFIVAVHYFGKEYDFNSIKTLCKNKAILIEDAVHVAMPYGKVGKFGDVCIYSPWKIYGLNDGAVLSISSDEVMGLSKEELFNEINNAIHGLVGRDNKKLNLWRCKKLIQRFLPNINKQKNNSGNGTEQNNNHDERPHRISDYSACILSRITQREMQTLMERKKEISLSVEDYLFRKYGISSFYKGTFVNEMPYALILETEDDKVKQRIIREINQIGSIAYEWPDLPQDLPSDSNAWKIKERLLLISVHDAIRFERIRKKLDVYKFYKVNEEKRIDIEPINETEYKRFTDENFTPILQSLIYGYAKESVQGWKRLLYGIMINNKLCAVFTVLKKHGIINRINNGPVFIDNISDEDKISAIKAIRRNFSGLKGVLFFAPSIEKTGFNINCLLASGFCYRYRNYTTGLISLDKSEDQLRKCLSSKWRNCLKNAEKRNLSLKYMKTDEEFSILLGHHAEDKLNRKYDDSGDRITEFLFKNKAIKGAYVCNQEGEIISFIFFVVHGKTATYYIGWSNEEGYKTNASRLLLWTGALKLKELGYHWLDLGGIDYINTKGIAEFKDGTGSDRLEYIGEFVAL